MQVDIILFCHKFQRRLCWFLSSVLQQIGDIPDTRIDIVCLENDGNPTTEAVADAFCKRGLCVDLTHVTKKELARPSLTKNIQIENSRADWIMTWSADQILSPDYMVSLRAILENECVKHRGCIYSPFKMMVDKEATEQLIECNPDIVVNNAFDKLKVLPVQADKSALRHRVGGHLVFSRDAINARCGGLYVPKELCTDRHLFRRGMKTRSDMGFRRRMGRTKRIELPLSIHMGHDRDKEQGKHIEVQR